MASKSKSKSSDLDAVRKRNSDPEHSAPEVSDATDGGDSRLTKGYSDNPDKPDPTSVAQIENLHEEESGE